MSSSWRKRAERPKLEALEARITPTTDLILDFDGGTLQTGQGYGIPSGFEGTHTAFTQFPASGTGGGTSNRTEQILQVVAGVRMDYADFDVRVIWDDRGVNSPFFDATDTVIMIVGDASPGLFGIAASVDIGPPLQSLRDTALAFGPSHFNLDTPATARRSIRELTDTISHEGGHTFGLSHATQSDAQQRQITTTATQNSNLDSRFSTTAINHGSPEAGSIYAEATRLTSSLGAALAGTTLISNETVTNQTLPLDTTANPFDGVTPLTLPGQIDFAGDRDAYRVTFATAGTFNVRMQANTGSAVDPIFTVWDVEGDWVATSQQGPTGTGGAFSKMDVTVTAGQTLYVVAGTSFDRSLSTVIGTRHLGTYTVTVGAADGNGAGAGTGGGGGGGGGGAVAGPTIVAVGTDVGGPPVVRIYDTTGVIQRQIYAYDRRFTGGVRVATADVNGDGTADIITGAGVGGGPHVKVFDGATGVELANFFPFDPKFTGGVYVAGGDVNGDGKADIIIAAGAGGGPHVKIFSGADGQLLTSFFAYETSFRGGVFLATGDVNGDGITDIVTGTGIGGGPLVRAFDGGTGAILKSFLAYAGSFRGGVNVAVGDVNGDGLADIITGPGVSSSQIKVFNSATDRVITTFGAFSSTITTQFVGDSRYGGGARVFAIDADGDGLLDIAVTPTAGGKPKVMLFKGTGGAFLSSFDAFDSLFLGGVFVG